MDVVHDERQRTIRATHLVVDDRAGAPLVGLESRYSPSVGVVGGIVAIAQLAQVMLYSVDDLDRGSSDTLWMRRISIRVADPFFPLGDAFTSTVSAPRMDVVDMPDRGRWRLAELDVPAFGPVSGRASVAHRLPDAVPADGLAASVGATA